MKTYYGKIRLTTGGHPIDVQVQASSPQAAKKIIEAQYSGKIAQWVRHMASTN